MVDRKYNVATIDADFISPRGGLNTFASSFEDGMQERGHKIIEFSPYRYKEVKVNKATIPIKKNYNYQFNCYSPILLSREFEALNEISECIVDKVEAMQEEIDIFNGTDWPCGLILQKIKERKESRKIREGLKTLAVIHNGYYQGVCKDKNVNLLEVLINNADEIATVGESFGKEWANYDFHPKIPNDKKLHILPNGLNAEMTENPSLESRFSNKIPEILFFSRPTKEKGFESLYQALPSISEYFRVNFTDIQYTDLTKSTLSRNCKNYPTVNNWMYSKKELDSIYLNKAVAVINPSGYTPFELCPREGILKGAFPIITNIGSHKDGFKDISQIGGNCIMIDCNGLKGDFWTRPRDVLELGTRIADATKRFYDLLTKQEGIQRLQYGIDKTIEEYKKGNLWSMDKCIENYENLYTQMLSE